MKAIELTVSVRNNRMKSARRNRHLSQKELALLLGTSQVTICEIESLKKIKWGKKRETREIQASRRAEMKHRIASFFETTVEEMFPDALDAVVSNRVVRTIDVPEALQINANGERNLLAEGEKEAFRIIETEGMNSIIDETINTLKPREQQIIRLRFGIYEGATHPRTLAEVGKIFGANRERIKQIEAKALRKLRHPSRSRPLRPFING